MSSVAKSPCRGLVLVFYSHSVYGLLGSHNWPVCRAGFAGLYGEIGRYGQYRGCRTGLGMYGESYLACLVSSMHPISAMLGNDIADKLPLGNRHLEQYQCPSTR